MGQEVVVARRAVLEDMVAVRNTIEGIDFEGLLDAQLAKDIRFAIETISGMATAELAIFKEMRELDTRLGLNPKGLADLRWTIVPDAEEPAAPTDGATPITSGRRTHLASTG